MERPGERGSQIGRQALTFWRRRRRLRSGQGLVTGISLKSRIARVGAAGLSFLALTALALYLGS